MRLLILLSIVAVSFALRVRVKGTVEADDWNAYKAKFSKSYGVHEDKMRRVLYSKAIEEINMHNAEYDEGKWTFWQGVNEHIDWTQEEYDSRNGYKPKTHKHDIPIRSPASNIPDSIDWRSKGAVGPVKDQGNCGSCWAFGTIGALEGQQFIVNGILDDCGEQQLVSCDHNNAGCNGGNDAFDYIRDNGKNGIDTTKSYRYTGRDDTCNRHKTHDGKGICAVISGSERAADGEVPLKEAVGNVGPITIGVNASPSSFGRYSGGIYDDPSCDNRPNHMVTAVGYDTAGNYWIVKNSWGSSWGESGYIRFIYGKEMCAIGCDMAVWPTM